MEEKDRQKNNNTIYINGNRAYYNDSMNISA